MIFQLPQPSQVLSGLWKGSYPPIRFPGLGLPSPRTRNASEPWRKAGADPLKSLQYPAQSPDPRAQSPEWFQDLNHASSQAFLPLDSLRNWLPSKLVQLQEEPPVLRTPGKRPGWEPKTRALGQPGPKPVLPVERHRYLHRPRPRPQHWPKPEHRHPLPKRELGFFLQRWTQGQSLLYRFQSRQAHRLPQLCLRPLLSIR